MEISEIKALVEKALEDRILTSKEHAEIIDAIMADHEISPEEQEILHSMLEEIAKGNIQTVE